MGQSWFRTKFAVKVVVSESLSSCILSDVQIGNDLRGLRIAQEDQKDNWMFTLSGQKICQFAERNGRLSGLPIQLDPAEQPRLIQRLAHSVSFWTERDHSKPVDKRLDPSNQIEPEDGKNAKTSKFQISYKSCNKLSVQWDHKLQTVTVFNENFPPKKQLLKVWG